MHLSPHLAPPSVCLCLFVSVSLSVSLSSLLLFSFWTSKGLITSNEYCSSCLRQWKPSLVRLCVPIYRVSCFRDIPFPRLKVVYPVRERAVDMENIWPNVKYYIDRLFFSRRRPLPSAFDDVSRLFSIRPAFSCPHTWRACARRFKIQSLSDLAWFLRTPPNILLN